MNKKYNVLILSDGKIGHIKQSQAFVAVLKFEADVTNTLISIQYKNKLARTLADICASFFKRNTHDRRRLYRKFITEETAKALENVTADMIVSTGSYTAPINKMLASALGAKSVVILKPNSALNSFDLNIIPEHDVIGAGHKKANIIRIKGALTYPGSVEVKKAACSRHYQLSSDPKIACFIGGIFERKEIYLKKLSLFIQELKRFALQQNVKIVLSTSRRTPVEAENLILRELEHFSQTEAIVCVSKENYDFVFEGFVALSNIVFVTGESISMISEVLSQEKPCVGVMLETYDKKRNMFFSSLTDEMISLYEPYPLDSIEPIVPKVVNENTGLVQSAIRRFL